MYCFRRLTIFHYGKWTEQQITCSWQGIVKIFPQKAWKCANQINLLNLRKLNEWPFIVLPGRFKWCILQYFREYILTLNTAAWYNVLSVFRSWGNSYSWFPQVREKILQGQGKVRENLILWRKSGKSKILRVYIYSFLSTFTIVWHLKLFCSFYGRESHCIVRMLFMKLNDKLC